MVATTTRRRRWPLAVGLLVIAAVAVLLIAGFFVGRRVVAESRGYCARCHAEQAEHPGTPGHEEISCQACHAPPEGRTVLLLLPWLRTSWPLPEHGAVEAASCAACHEEDEAEWAALMATPGHASHSIDPGPNGCIRCHSATLHGSPFEDEGCMSCHEDVPLSADVGFHIDCVACHSFRSHDPTIPPRPGPSTEFGAVQVTQEHIHGAADCRSCHSPHAEPEDAIGRCRRCHRGAISASVEQLPEVHRDCRSCHNVHAERRQIAMPCLGCHPTPRISKTGAARVERAERRRGKASSTTKVSPTPLSREEREKLPHKGRCETCHNPHEAESWGARCDQCHEEQSLATSRLPAGTHDGCTKCHEPHSPAPGFESCAECHDRQSRQQRRAVKEHRDCLGCHGAHDGAPKRGRTCSRCHEKAERELRRGEARHRDCTACHGSHGDSVAGVDRECRLCHQEQARKAVTAPEPRHRLCTSCHEPHEMTGKAALRRCSECHEEPAKAGAAHRGKCIDCHEQHGRTSKNKLSCRRCHDKVRPPVARDHSRCQDCHEPHEPAKAAECVRCHAKQARGNRMWPADNPHGRACSTCHKPHNPLESATCTICHVPQATRDHTGSHKRCVDCHRDHLPRPSGSEGWWSECGRCHDEQARAVRRASETHRRCSQCHKNSGWSPPSCVECHETTSRQLLHATKDHRECTRCHDTHGTDQPGRSKCVSCHEKMAGHYPDAPRCQACHPFSIKGSAKSAAAPFGPSGKASSATGGRR